MSLAGASIRTIRRLPVIVFLTAVALLTLLPLIYAFFGSFKSLADLISSGATLLPEEWVLGNYEIAWTEANFARSLRNSATITLSVVVIGVFASAMAGYMLSRKLVFATRFWMALMGGAIFLGAGTATLYPRYVIAQTLGLTNLVGIILLELAAITLLTTFLVFAFCQDMGKEIEEAAKIDGCGLVKSFFLITMPMLRPILTTVAVLAFQWSWNSFQVPLVFTLPRPDMQTVTVAVFALKSSAGDGFGEYTILLAGAVMALVPIVVLYVIAQKYFMEGLTEGALK